MLAAACVVSALSLGGCAADSHYGARVISVPDKNDWRTCEQLAGLLSSNNQQIKDIEKLMQKAERDAGGGFVNATVHRPNLVKLQAERQMVSESIAKNNCAAPKT